MTTSRSRTIAALVAAVLVLLASVGTAVAVGASRDGGSGDDREGQVSRCADTDGSTGQPWMADPDDAGRGGSMMGERGAGHGWMMGSGSSRQAWMDDWPDGWSGAGWGDSKSFGWNGTDPVTAAEARKVAQQWLDRYATPAALGDPVAMPMGYRFLASQGGTVVAMIMVDDDTGTVFGHLRPTAIR